MIEDLSFSKIVDIIQHDNKVASEMLVQIAKEKEIVDNNYQDLEIKLQQLKTRQLQLKKGALLVLKHLKKETPLAVQKDGFIVVVSEDNVSIERNVL
tara:strand:+ start:381 stop:671 length:291 start_codon:yes stop_codon:yes gene_type:complete